MNLPQRGEVWWADCGMAGKIRPVVVISVPFGDADRALLTVVPHTGSLIGSEFEVPIPVPWLAHGAFNVQATFPLPPPRFISRIDLLNAEQLARIESTLKRWEGLS
jgi:mRNA interferase MazF